MFSIMRGALLALMMGLLVAILSGCGADQYVGKWRVTGAGNYGDTRAVATKDVFYEITKQGDTYTIADPINNKSFTGKVDSDGLMFVVDDSPNTPGLKGVASIDNTNGHLLVRYKYIKEAENPVVQTFTNQLAKIECERVAGK